MIQNTPIAVVALVAALVVAPVAAAAPPGGAAGPYAAEETETPTPDANASVSPGERLSGVVGVQQAEIEGEVDERTFGVRLARADGNASRADVVADQVEDVDRRIREQEQRRETLREARENGSMSEGEFRARMARVATEMATTRRLANASGEAGQGLPEDVLAERGINVTAIRSLQQRAANLSGPEVAEIARSIAGSDVGRSMAGAGRPGGIDDRGPGADNVTRAPDGSDGAVDAGGAADSLERADRNLTRAQERLDRANRTVGQGAGDTARTALERARENLSQARERLAEARAASQDGDAERARSLATEAIRHAQAALEYAQDAIDAAGEQGQR